MGITESDKLICKKNSIWIIMYIKVIHSKLIESS